MPSFPMQSGAGALTSQTLQSLQAMVNAIFGSPGQVWWVNPFYGSDSNNGQTPATAFATLAQAHASASDGNNDIVYLMANSNTASQTTSYQSSGLTWSKSLLHLIGWNGGPMLGQRSRIAPLATAATFPNLVTLSGNGCLFANLEFFQGATATNPSTASTCVTVSGQRNHFVNCQISGIGHSDLDDTGSNDLTVSGSENLFEDCYIGLDTIIRTSALAGVVMSGTNTRNMFRRCFFVAYTSSTSYKFMTVATGTDRWLRLNDCDFAAIPNLASSAIPTGAIGITTMNGFVVVKNPALFGVAQIVTADNAYVVVLGLNGLATGHLIGIAQAVDAA